MSIGAPAEAPASTLDHADIRQALTIPPAMHQFLAAGRAGSVLEGFHFHCAGPVSRLALHQHDVRGANAHDVEDTQ